MSIPDIMPIPGSSFVETNVLSCILIRLVSFVFYYKVAAYLTQTQLHACGPCYVMDHGKFMTKKPR